MLTLIRRFSIFVFSVCILLGILEYQTQILPNNYLTKEAYLLPVADQVEVLILGNSQAYMGVNPSEFDVPAFTLANTAQTLRYDWEMFNRYASRPPSLKQIYLGVSYPSLFTIAMDLPGDFNRSYHYRHFLGINGDTKWYQIKSWSMVNVYSIERTIDRLYGHYNGTESLTEFDSLGWYNDPIQRDLDQNAEDACSFRNDYIHQRNLPVNLDYLTKILDLADQHDISVTIFSPPLYQQYRDYMIPEFYDQGIRLLDSISSQRGIQFLNATASPDYQASDFFDSNHLRKEGAKKLTATLIHSTSDSFIAP